MFTAKDGKHFGNHEMGRHYDKTRPEPKTKAKEDEGEGEVEREDSDMPMGDVVAEHGVAHKSEIKADEDGEHTVTTHHEDGHKHVSHGHDAHSAHMHSMHAMTGEEPEGMEHEEPDGDEGEEEEAPMIPGMRG
jgi:hypothetical protein